MLYFLSHFRPDRHTLQTVAVLGVMILLFLAAMGLLPAGVHAVEGL